MLLTNHVLSGALVGALTRRPLPAFAAGIASHFVLDAVPHWGEWGSRRRFIRVAVPDGLVSLAAMGAIAVLSPADRRLAVVAGMSGAALPDVEKPTSLWFGWSPFPSAVDRFHSRIQREAPGRARLELLAAGVFACAALIAIRGSWTRLPRGLSSQRAARADRHSGQRRPIVVIAGSAGRSSQRAARADRHGGQRGPIVTAGSAGRSS